MGALSLRNAVTISANIHLLSRALELDLDWDKTDTIVDQIARLRWVESVEDRHQFYCELILDTHDPATATRRITATMAKIERILMRYRKAP